MLTSCNHAASNIALLPFHSTDFNLPYLSRGVDVSCRNSVVHVTIQLPISPLSLSTSQPSIFLTYKEVSMSPAETLSYM